MALVNKQILAIDDTASIRTFLRISLQSQGAIFHEAGTAMQGVELAEKIQPDMIVLDLGLPDKDGLEILPLIKKSAQNTPIVILTVRKDQHLKDKALKLGAKAYMTKPFMMEDLLEVMETHLA